MAFQEILEKIGGMGRYQIIHVILLALPVFMLASHNLLQNFTAAIPKHRCKLNASQEEGNFTGLWLHAHIPLESNGKLSSCLRYTSPQPNLLNYRFASNASDLETEMCADGYEYDDSEYSSTIINQWDLVCNRRRMRQLAQSIYMAGVLVGSIVFGGLSDKFGRRPLNIWSNLQMFVTGICAAFAPNYVVYCVFRFLTGAALSGIVLNSYSLIVEWIPTEYRAFTSTVTGYCYTTGQLVLVGLAFMIQDWRMLQMAASLPFFIYFLYSWWLPESSRWLVLGGKYEQAIKDLRKVARINGKTEEGEKLTVETIKYDMQREIKACRGRSYSVLDLVKTPVVRRISFCICLTWFSTSFAYYGLAMDLQKFGLSIYIVQVTFGSVDFPAKFISYFVMTYLGRRILQASSLILAGTAILVNIFVPEEFLTVKTIVTVLGKGCLAASFNCVFLYTGELYPTVIRQSGMGLGTMVARFGGIFAPLVQMTADYYVHLPLIIFSLCPILSGIAACFLPETLGVPLPETIQDVESPSHRKKVPKSSEEISLKVGI
ncbi:solute carrier family 22 member 6-B-like [Hyla sarda]|uniref:solute carrier family 22 member 6-B-like n=1 Tax=Hyla sarda TaxID=327740 RepID=UPI0024C42A21|nr:solute carrier family 22 member 6-B-like [Hyla sarda]